MSSTTANITPSQSHKSEKFELSKKDPKEIDLKVINDSVSNDLVEVALDDVYKSLTVLGQKVISKLEEILGDKLPEGGIAALKPEDHTPEATAQRIVDGVTGLLPAFQAQNPDLEGEELLDQFMSTIRGGIQQGYGEAMEILGSIGALEFDSVSSGIEKTMKIVEEKLVAFETDYREKFLRKPTSDEQAAPGNTTAQTSPTSSPGSEELKLTA